MKKWDKTSWVILALWVVPLAVFMGINTYVSSTGHFLTQQESGIVMTVCFTMITGAMVLKTLKNRKKHADVLFWVHLAFLGVYFCAGVYSFLLRRI